MTPEDHGQAAELTVIEREGDHDCGYREGIRRIHAALDGAGHDSGLSAAMRVERLLTDHRGAVAGLEALEDALLRYLGGAPTGQGEGEAIKAATTRALARQGGQS